MTATVELTDSELAELRELTALSEPSAALRAAMMDYVRYARRMRLKELAERMPDVEHRGGSTSLPLRT